MSNNLELQRELDRDGVLVDVYDPSGTSAAAPFVRVMQGVQMLIEPHRSAWRQRTEHVGQLAGRRYKATWGTEQIFEHQRIYVPSMQKTFELEFDADDTLRSPVDTTQSSYQTADLKQCQISHIPGSG